MFDVKAIEKIGYYVYALFDPIDPKNMSMPFYVGKGSGNRVFSHADGEIPADLDETQMPAKMEKIRKIKDRNQSVKHVILRYGLSEDEAFLIEATIIDILNYIAPDALRNQISGKRVSESIIDAEDLATSLMAEPFKSDTPVLIIKIEGLWTKLLQEFKSANDIPQEKIYKATRASWKINPSRAARADCILSVARGLIREVFIADEWHQDENSDRKYFVGSPAPAKYRKFIGQSVALIFKKGGQNPIRYYNC